LKVALVELLPHLNASLNAASGVLLVVGWRFARSGRERPHRACMASAFTLSVLFLISYLTRYALTGNHVYPGTGWDRTLYLAILVTHVSLAALVPWLAIRTLYLALRRRIDTHRRWARFTLPIWLYVSVTGVIVYGMLYHYAAA
jgi:putative membrane protein